MRRVGGWGGVHAGRTMASRHDGCEISSHHREFLARPPFAAQYFNTVLKDGDTPLLVYWAAAAKG